MQIFRGEGEVTDVYVSHKRRRFGCSKFGFVRFKKLEEATNAINNLNGEWIRERRIKVTFAKYGKKGMFCNGPAIMETDMEKKPAGGNEKSMSYTRDGRSFKEVVEGWPQHPKGGDQMRRRSRELEASNDDEVRRQLEKVKVKEMVWRVAEEFFNANNLEEIKHHLGTCWRE